MERASPASVYERWEEFYVSGDKGKREVHYYLKRKDGTGSDLVVIGKEKTLRHMSYHFAFKERSLHFNFANSSSFLAKLRSRREVVDWLNSIIDLGEFMFIYIYIYIFIFFILEGIESWWVSSSSPFLISFDFEFYLLP